MGGWVTAMGALRHHAPVLLLLALVALPLLLVASVHEVSSWLESRDRGEVDASPVVVVPDAPVDAGDDSFTVSYPNQWLPSRGRECSDYRGRTMCNGPRKAAAPWGAAAELAKELGLGSEEAVLTLLRYGPPREWIDMVDGESTDAFHWAVEGGKLWRGFGFIRKVQKGTPHNGIDIGAPAGSHIRSAADGIVGYSDNTQPGYGNMILIIHADGRVGLYAHCLANYAFPGQKVMGGDVIGEVGTTGIARGAHLHFELRVKGIPRNPLPFFRKGLVEHPLDAGPDGDPHEPYDASAGPDGSSSTASDAGL